MEHGIPQDILRRLLEARNIMPGKKDGAMLARLLEEKENAAPLHTAELGRILRLAVREYSREPDAKTGQ